MIPKISHRQFLALSGLREAWLTPSYDLRSHFDSKGAPLAGPAFYQLMQRMERAGLVQSELIAPWTYYRITAEGARQRIACREFYV